jgi:hypothetical protein
LGQILVHWQSAELDVLFRAAEAELDPVKRAALFILMNDLVVGDGYVCRSSPARARRAALRKYMDEIFDNRSFDASFMPADAGRVRAEWVKPSAASD